MVSRKSAEPSPERIARANRQRLSLEEGARAMAEIEQQAIAVRKNMERLRALRTAREAQATDAQTALPGGPGKKRKKPRPNS
ncbi:MAG: transcriptional regulator [Bradyrhizobium sp.]|uniref:transcriptional regulator n=1 Tax=Bradyrhizobium sp. TaxID=376 RepID=UPI001D8808EE|nr:transcriptional regulator [Bradyrhizobium sp.]MBV9565927.1 transcriptional regulator [Bradyrhizobium sp.]